MEKCEIIGAIAPLSDDDPRIQAISEVLDSREGWRNGERPMKLYKAVEAAAILNVSISTIYRWRDNGAIKVVKINGSSCRYPESELIRLQGELSE